jgi:predicted Rossmann-fold nucleotide-binding protein
MPARNIVVVCSGSHEKKVNLGEVFRSFGSQWEIRMPARNIVVVCSGSHEKKVNLGEVFRSFGLSGLSGGSAGR